ncbi:MAG TPA: MFS transporter [Pseudonocardiaceae bacterium]|nr:MFS transporter [Pseudonocardiaceae bacterium]
MKDRRWALLALVGSAYFMTVLDGTSMLAALPSIRRSLDLTGPALQWTVTAYALAFGGPLLCCGRAADLLGRGRMFRVGMLLRVLASLACGLAPSVGFLVAARAVQGCSAAIIAPAALSMVLGAFPEGPERNRALGIWGGLGGVGATAGLLLGGVLTDALGWPWIFWINVPIGVVVLLLAPALLPVGRPAGGARSLDVAGAVTSTVTLSLAVYTIIQLPTAGWLSTRTGLCVAGIGVLATVFLVVERRSAHPLVPVRLLRSRSLAGGNLLVLVAGMAVDGMLVTLTAYVQQGMGWSALRFGLLAAMMTATSVAGALASQRAVTRFGVRAVAIGGAAGLLGAGVLLVALPDGGAVWLMLVALFAFGAGMGAAVVSGQIAALSGVRTSDSGFAASLVDACFSLGTAFGAAICTTVAGTAVTVDFAGWRAAFGMVAGFAVVGLLVAVTWPRPGRAGTRRPDRDLVSSP